MGKSLAKRMDELIELAPLGMELNVIYLQTEAVTTAINSFLINLGEAVLIVIVVLLVFMGLRSGLIIGGVLMITILGTFIFMDFGEVTLERISLGALVIALGMLVDNAIVVVDGMRVKMDQGSDALTAAREIVGQVGVPLLGATLIAIAAFASIGTSQDGTGEYCRTLFYVILISLGLSWVTAVTSTPLLCKTFLKQKSGTADEPDKDPYDSGFYRGYRSFLGLSIKFRWITVAVVVGLFIMSIVGFGFVKNSFFPDSTSPQYLIDFWFPEGTSIEETSRLMEKAEQYVGDQEGVNHVVTFIGGGQIRFLLTYTPESLYPSYAQMFVQVDDYKKIPDMLRQNQQALEQLFPGGNINTRAFILGPSTGGKIQLRINGPDPTVLRELGDKAEAILLADPMTKGVRNEWRNKIMVVRPQLAEAQARRLGIDRPQVAQAIEAAIQGTPVGVYREQDDLLPIIARSPEIERTDLENLKGIQVWSPAAQRNIPLGQVVPDITVTFEDAHVWRRDRTTMMRIHADTREGLPSELFARVKPMIEQALGADVEQKLGHSVALEDWDAKTIPVAYRDRIPLKEMPGYSISWGGEAEDSGKAQVSLAGSIPIFFGLMVLLVIILFNSIKKT